MPHIISGILDRICEMTLFLNTSDASYRRFGNSKAPGYVTWSPENRSQLVRIPAADGEYRRAELRSPDPLCNPYIAFALMIRASLDGIERGLKLPEGVRAWGVETIGEALRTAIVMPASNADKQTHKAAE